MCKIRRTLCDTGSWVTETVELDKRDGWRYSPLYHSQSPWQLDGYDLAPVLAGRLCPGVQPSFLQSVCVVVRIMFASFYNALSGSHGTLDTSNDTRDTCA